MSADRELLEMAAKAAGKEGGYLFRAGGSKGSGLPYDIQGFQLVGGAMWNPLTDDGDALRLAVKLDIQVWRRPSGVEGVHKGSVLTNPQTEPLTPCPYAATRRAIVRAAAEIGKLKLAAPTGDHP